MSQSIAMHAYPPDWEIVRSVSRSFYLSLRFLPVQIRNTLAFAYLLARASDTMADCSGANVSARLHALQAFGEGKWDKRYLLDFLRAKQEEKALLQRIPSLLAGLESQPDKDLIRDVFSTIVSGQMLDLERFSTGENNVLTKTELEDYTYRVAGCVGKFWTQLCFRRIPRTATLSEEKMITLGIEYGKGLQLVNILRDYSEDMANGRRYFSREDFDSLVEKALTSLEAGRRYVSALRGFRLRFCSHMPCALGFQTLELLSRNPAVPGMRVPRSRVYLTALGCLFDAVTG